MRSLRLIVLAALTPITLAAVSFPAPTSASCVAPSFGAATAFSAGNSPLRVMAGDFNGDGYLDLAATNYNDDTGAVRPSRGSSRPWGARPGRMFATTPS